MLKYRFSDYYWLYGFAIASWAIVFFLIILTKEKKNPFKVINRKYSFLFFISVAFSFLGLAIGILVGSSLSPVIGVVIPALMTFFGGFITYAFVFGKENTDATYTMIVIVVSISFFLILGSDYSASMRVDFQGRQSLFEDSLKKDFEVFKAGLGNKNEADSYATPSNNSNNPVENSDTIKCTENKK